MKMPPFLLGATLLFWGWQTGLVVPALLMAMALEAPRWRQTRWELSEQDFTRVWVFCALLLLAAVLFAFTANEGPSSFRGFFQNPTPRTERNAGTTLARTIASLIRWLPMLFFMFMGAQVWSSRQRVPLQTVSLIMRLRWKKAQRLGLAMPESKGVDVSYPYFGLCLMAASAHPSEDKSFFWGLCVLLGWGLWPHRTGGSRSGRAWPAVLAIAVVLGYLGQANLLKLQRYLETLNPPWLSSFSGRRVDPAQTKTDLGHIGRLKTSAKIVIRLQPRGNEPAPPLLREASYRNYKAQTWYAGSLKLNDDFVPVLNETNDTTFLLVRGKTNTMAVNIACYLAGRYDLIPLPPACGRLENLLALKVEKNSAGAVRVQGPGLLIYDAGYGPGQTMDSHYDEEDIKVRDDNRTREAAALDKVIPELQLTASATNTEQKLRAVSAFFQSKFDYSTWQEPPRMRNPEETPLSRFLLQNRKGHCEYFATATVLLLRRLGIPARYAVGYAVHEIAGDGYVVRQRDAHAWCLVWNAERQAWQDFDTTPSSWVALEQARSTRYQGWSDFWSRVMFEISKVRWGQTHLRQYILWGLVPVLAFLLYQITLGTRRKRAKANGAERQELVAWPGLDSEFYQLERRLASQGMIRGASEPVSVWLGRAGRDVTFSELRQPLKALLQLHYRYRFDPQGLSAGEREALREQASRCLSRLEK
jgi:hypothetical protein